MTRTRCVPQGGRQVQPLIHVPGQPATFAVTLGDNHLYSSVTPQVNCGTTYDLSAWLKFGLDKGTQVHGEPSVEEIMAWGQALLGWQ